MRRWRFLALLIGIVLLAVILFLFWQRRLRADDYGPLVALCPGPDYYGYICENGTAVAYINATHDTQLYQLDGVTKIQLPFSFTFYGTTYSELYASSNGNLQFGNSNPAYINDCLDEGPAPEMGDMIAPYWDDLDLRFIGFLETEVVGEEPNRIFVVEWDGVPRFETGEPLTFEVQLFENSNHIVFLYQNVEQPEGNHASKATIGLQSEEQGLVLQFSCNLPAVTSVSQIRFPHPVNPNGDVGLALAPVAQEQAFTPGAKGDTAVLLRQLQLRGDSALVDLHKAWLAQTPPVTAVWERTDLTGDGRDELIILRHSTPQHPHLTQLIVLGHDEAGEWNLLIDRALSNRQQAHAKFVVEFVGDLTRDGLPDLLLAAPESGYAMVLTAGNDTIDLLSLPLQCSGGLAVRGEDIVRDGCGHNGRVWTAWDGEGFSLKP